MVIGTGISLWRLAQSQVNIQTRREAYSCCTYYGNLHSICLLPHLHNSGK